MLNININNAIDHGALFEAVLADHAMSRAGNSFKMYVDRSKVDELPNEVALMPILAKKQKDIHGMKLDQVWGHLTQHVAPFNQREATASGGTKPVYTVELMSVTNVDGIRNGEEPANPIAAGDPEAKEKAKKNRGRRDLNDQGFYPRTQREQTSAPPQALMRPAEATGSPMS